MIFCCVYRRTIRVLDRNSLPPKAMCDFHLTTFEYNHSNVGNVIEYTRVGTLIVATIYLQLIQNRYMIRSFTVLQRSHQHCVQPVASDVEVVGYL